MATVDSKKKGEHQREAEEAAKTTMQFFEKLGITVESLPQNTSTRDYMSELMASFLKVDSISRGRVTCSFTVLPPFVNGYSGFHGGVVATVAIRLATACARTVVSEEKPLILGEQSISYLYAASINDKLVADGKVLRSGRNITTVLIKIRQRETKKLLYTAHATFYHIPLAEL